MKAVMLMKTLLPLLLASLHPTSTANVVFGADVANATDARLLAIRFPNVTLPLVSAHLLTKDHL